MLLAIKFIGFTMKKMVYIDIGFSKLLLYKRLKKSILYINILIITLINSFICSLEEKIKKIDKKIY